MPSFRGYRYFVLFKDDFSRYHWVYFMKEKSEVSSKLEEMLAEARTSGNTVKELLSDNGLEFDNEKVRKILWQHGVKQRLITPYTPQQNGCAERDNRTLVEAARVMLYAHSNLPKRLWAELVNTAAYIINRTGVSAVEGKSPFELWFGKKPSIKHLKVIGTTCYAHIPERGKSLIRKLSSVYYEILKELKNSETSISSKRELRDRSLIKQPAILEDYVLNAEEFINDEVEPHSFSEAIRGDSREHWIRAMQNEITSLKKNQTWNLEKLLRGRKAIPCKWIFKIKRNPDGSISKYKARLVAKGFNQKEGIDFSETFSPVSRLSTVRSVLSVAARDKLFLLQFDVSAAFLYGDLEEDIYMILPEGCDDGSGRVCHLKRSLYGLKQAPRCWNKKCNDFLTKEGFKSGFADPCLYIRNRNGRKLILVLYVDDGLITSSNKEDVEQFLTDLKKSFQISCSEAKFYLGLEIAQEKDGIKITQKGYIEKILKFNMENANPVDTNHQKLTEY